MLFSFAESYNLLWCASRHLCPTYCNRNESQSLQISINIPQVHFNILLSLSQSLPRGVLPPIHKYVQTCFHVDHIRHQLVGRSTKMITILVNSLHEIHLSVQSYIPPLLQSFSSRHPCPPCGQLSRDHIPYYRCHCKQHHLSEDLG